MSDVKSKDMELYLKWKETGSKRHLGELIDQLSPVIYSEVSRASGSLPNSALAAEAKKWTVKAIQTYNPDKGTTLSTHVMNYLPKVRRLNYKFQNAVRLPENMQLKYHEYNRSVTQLTEELNRDPSDEEVAKHIGWSKPQVVKFRNSLYADLIESQSERPGEYTHFNENALLMAHLMDQLSPEEKYILENSKNKSATEIANHLGVNLNRYNYLKSKLKDKIMAIKHDIGL